MQDVIDDVICSRKYIPEDCLRWVRAPSRPQLVQVGEEGEVDDAEAHVAQGGGAETLVQPEDALSRSSSSSNVSSSSSLVSQVLSTFSASSFFVSESAEIFGRWAVDWPAAWSSILISIFNFHLSNIFFIYKLSNKTFVFFVVSNFQQNLEFSNLNFRTKPQVFSIFPFSNKT